MLRVSGACVSDCLFRWFFLPPGGQNTTHATLKGSKHVARTNLSTEWEKIKLMFNLWIFYLLIFNVIVSESTKC